MELEIDYVYRNREDKKLYCLVGFYKHPKHRDYHVNWTGEYVIYQHYGNFKEPLLLMDRDRFIEQHETGWAPMKVCKYCGFSRMCPCTVPTPNCPNLGSSNLMPGTYGDV